MRYKEYWSFITKYIRNKKMYADKNLLRKIQHIQNTIYLSSQYARKDIDTELLSLCMAYTELDANTNGILPDSEITHFLVKISYYTEGDDISVYDEKTRQYIDLIKSIDKNSRRITDAI